jgi:hypothetical protein
MGASKAVAFQLYVPVTVNDKVSCQACVLEIAPVRDIVSRSVYGFSFPVICIIIRFRVITAQMNPVGKLV